MSRSISIIFILLIIIIAGFAFLNYNRLNQMSSDLLKRQATLEESERLIKEQETSISELAEKMKEVIEKQELPEEQRTVDIEEELLGLQLKIGELVQMKKSDTEGIVLLGEEKAKIEALLAEKEGQWQEREEESRRVIASLQNEIQKYELESKTINEKVLNIETHLSSEQSKRKELEKDLLKLEDTISILREQLALKQDDEGYVQQIGELLFSKKQLEEEIATRDSNLAQVKQEYEEIFGRLDTYQGHIEELKQELQTAKEKGDAQLKEQFAVLQNEKEITEKMLADKQEEWNRQNEDNLILVAYLNEQLGNYKKEVELVKEDRSLFREEIVAEIELQQKNATDIKEREEQVSSLIAQIEEYIDLIGQYELALTDMKLKLEQQEDISYQEQQNLMDTIRSLVQARDDSQNSIYQLYGQVSKLQVEITELGHKVGLLEEGAEPKYYVVKRGDNLWNIARGKYKEGVAWVKIFNANKEMIQNPDLIYPYQQFIIPDQ